MWKLKLNCIRVFCVLSPLKKFRERLKQELMDARLAVRAERCFCTSAARRVFITGAVISVISYSRCVYRRKHVSLIAAVITTAAAAVRSCRRCSSFLDFLQLYSYFGVKGESPSRISRREEKKEEEEEEEGEEAIPPVSFRLPHRDSLDSTRADVSVDKFWERVSRCTQLRSRRRVIPNDVQMKGFHFSFWQDEVLIKLDVLKIILKKDSFIIYMTENSILQKIFFSYRNNISNGSYITE